ncbi:hypothetical protein WJX79_003819 [Trebouxia sp. C0005]
MQQRKDLAPLITAASDAIRSPKGDFRQAIHFWSLALEDKQAHPAVILANRSAAHAHLSCWKEACCDAEQAVLLQPEIALRIKPNATQLHQLLRQAEENLRAGFLSERHHEVSSAAQQAFSAAAEQVQHGHWQQALQQQSSQDSCSGHASFPISSDNKTVSAEDNACDVLNIKSGLPLADIRDAYVSAMKKTHPDKRGVC